MMMKILSALGSPLICIALIAFPGGLQAGTLYECRDQSGTVILTDAPLGAGYQCRPKGYFQDATEEQKAALEKERVETAEQRMKEEKEKAEAEKRRKEEEAARQKQLEDSDVKYRFW